MKITRLSTYLVPPRWLFLKVDTDEGISGWGEPIVEGRAATVAAAIEELSDYLVGEDPLQIEHHWQAMYRGAFYRGGPILMSAIAGVDQALWDIKGRYHNAPIHELMGGKVRDRIRVYAWVGGDTPADIVRTARAAIDGGFLATKMTITGRMQIVDSTSKIDSAAERIASLREAVGNKLDIAVDFHGRVHRPMAKVLTHAIEPYAPLFIEEPVLPEQLEFMAELRSSTHIPIATGERLYSRYDFKRLLELGAADIVQPDLSHAGGITECRKIANMAEAWDVALAPHCPLGPISLAACLQRPRTTPSSRSRARAAVIMGAMTSPTIWSILRSCVLTTVTLRSPMAPGSGLKSTRTLCANGRLRATAGIVRCGGTTTAASRSGELPRGSHGKKAIAGAQHRTTPNRVHYALLITWI